MQQRIRVEEVGPGMFKSERYVLIRSDGKSYGLFVDEVSVKDNTLEVQVISMDDESVLVELPRDTINAGSRVRVPRSDLVPTLVHR